MKPVVPPLPKNPTRAQAAHHLNLLYVAGMVSREQWSTLFDDMSNPARWVAEGEVATLPKGKAD